MTISSMIKWCNAHCIPLFKSFVDIAIIDAHENPMHISTTPKAKTNNWIKKNILEI